MYVDIFHRSLCVLRWVGEQVTTSALLVGLNTVLDVYCKILVWYLDYEGEFLMKWTKISWMR